MDRGCWCRPTAPNGPGRDRLREPRPPPSRSTIPTVTFAPAIRAREAPAIRLTPARLSSITILPRCFPPLPPGPRTATDRKSTRLNSSHLGISYAVFCLKKNIPQDAVWKPTLVRLGPRLHGLLPVLR